MSIINEKIQGVILDMDGVLWKDNEALVDFPTLFETIKRRNIKVTLATNNSTRTVHQYLQKISGFGVNLEEWQIINSPMAVAEYLRKKFPGGGAVYVIGEDGLQKSLEEHRFYHCDKEILAVVVGMDRKLTFEKLKKACLFIRQGKPFIGTNPDLTFPTPDGLVPGTGAILKCLEVSTNVTPILLGKPEPFMLEVARERMGTNKENTLVIGDRLETDILGGQKAGFKTAIVLSGVCNARDLEKWYPKPDYVGNNILDLFK